MRNIFKDIILVLDIGDILALVVLLIAFAVIAILFIVEQWKEVFKWFSKFATRKR